MTLIPETVRSSHELSVGHKSAKLEYKDEVSPDQSSSSSDEENDGKNKEMPQNNDALTAINESYDYADGRKSDFERSEF